MKNEKTGVLYINGKLWINCFYSFTPYDWECSREVYRYGSLLGFVNIKEYFREKL